MAGSTTSLSFDGPRLTAMRLSRLDEHVIPKPPTTLMSDDSDDVAFHVHEAHITAGGGCFLSKVAGVDEERAVAGPVHGGEVRAGDKVAPPP